MEIEDNVYEKSNKDLIDIINEFDKRAHQRTGHEDDDDDEPLYKRLKTSELSFGKGQSVAVIDKIREMELPREDGYLDNTHESFFAKNRPFSKEFISKEVERLKILDNDQNARWAMYMSGAMGKKVHEIYDRDDISRVIFERKKAEVLMREEIKRTIVPLREKEQELILLNEQKRQLINEQDILDNYAVEQVIAEKGVILIEGGKIKVDDTVEQVIGFIRLQQIIIEFANVLRKNLDPQLGSAYLNEFLDDHLDIDEEDDLMLRDDLIKKTLLNQMNNDRPLIDFMTLKVIWIRNYLLDATSSENLLFLHMKDSRALDYFNNSLGGEIKDFDMEKEIIQDQEFWKELFGSEVIFLPWLQQLYKPELIDDMIRRGIAAYQSHWGQRPSNKSYIYRDSMIDYLVNDKSYDGDRGLLTEQPREINEILTKVMTLESFPDNEEGREREEMFKKVLRAHFVWKYFHESAGLRLANDWFSNTKDVDDDVHIKRVMDPLLIIFSSLSDRYISYINAYYWFHVIPLLTNETLSNTLTQKKIFHLSAATKGFIMQYNGKDEKGKKSSLAGLFDLINDPSDRIDDIEKLIVDETFRNFYRSGELIIQNQEFSQKAKIPSLKTESQSMAYSKSNNHILTLNPALNLHFLYQIYLKFIVKHKKARAEQLQSVVGAIEKVNEKIVEISTETNPFDGARTQRFSGENPSYNQRRQFVNDVMNSGVIRLDSTIVQFMSTAYHKIQDDCPSLRGLPLEEYQADHASDSGLESEFANYVASQIAKQKHIYQETYKSQDQRINTKVYDGECFRRLKLYRYSSGYSFETKKLEYKSWRELPRPRRNTNNLLGFLFD